MAKLTLYPARADAPGGPRPSLTRSNDLAARAQAWANHLAEIGDLKHADSDDGENLYGSTGEPSFTDAVNAWVAEKKNYHGEKIGEIADFGSVGHYTQVSLFS